jgi:hypothetical protein
MTMNKQTSSKDGKQYEVVKNQSSFVALYLGCFRELTEKERDVLMDYLKMELTPIILYKETL